MPTRDIIDPELVSEELDTLTVEGEEEELTAADRLELLEEAERKAREKNNALVSLGSTVEQKFRKFAKNRAEKENEWITVLSNFNRRDNNYLEKGKLPARTKSHRKPSVNITRARTLTAIEKMQDIQFPLGGDYNFHIDAVSDSMLTKMIASEQPAMPAEGMAPPDQGPLPGSIPEVPGAPPAPQVPGQPPQTPSVGQQAQQAIKSDNDKAYNMEMKIKSQYVRTQYGRKARKAMRDWAILGTAILKGPVLETKKNKFYTHYRDSENGLQSELEQEFEEVPSVFPVDPRFFFPDSSLEADDVCECVELHPMSKKDLIQLTHDESFMKSKVRKVLDQDPNTTNSGISMEALYGFGSDIDLSDKYWVKEYHGPLPKDVLFELGEITEAEKEDELMQFYGSAWVVDGTVIRVSLSMLEGDDELIYQIVVWEDDDSSPFGHGMPYLMLDQQRVVEGTWQMLIDNSGLSAGPQFVMNKDSIEPANGKWEIEPMKIWYMTEFGSEVQSAFNFVDIPNNQQQLMNVIDAAMQFADIESQSPMIQAHTQPEANVPAMNMGMVMTEANVHQRELSQKWDDNITLPLVNRFIHYNIQYDDDENIKGNFKANVGGATERIDNQILAQDIERILSMGSQSPEYMLHIKADEAFRRWVSATRAGPELLRSSEEVEVEKQRLAQEAQNQPPDPELIRAQAVAAREEARQAELQAEQQMKAQEMQFNQQKQQQEMQMRTMEMRLRQAELLANAREKELELQIAMIEASNKQQVDLAKIRKDLAISDEQNELKRYLSALDFEKFSQEMDVKREEGTGI